MGASTNNNQVFRDYRLALYREQLGTVDLEFEDGSSDSQESDRIDVVGFERDFAEDCEPGSDLGHVLLTNGMLDLFDEHDYPPIFDPHRPSYV